MRQRWYTVYNPRTGYPIGKMRANDPSLGLMQRAGYIVL